MPLLPQRVWAAMQKAIINLTLLIKEVTMIPESFDYQRARFGERGNFASATRRRGNQNFSGRTQFDSDHEIAVGNSGNSD